MKLWFAVFSILFDIILLTYIAAGTIKTTIKIALILNLISVFPGLILYFWIAAITDWADKQNAIIGVTAIQVVGWGSVLIVLFASLFSIFPVKQVVKWRFALVSTIGAIICFPIVGLISLFFIIKNRKELGLHNDVSETEYNPRDEEIKREKHVKDFLQSLWDIFISWFGS